MSCVVFTVLGVPVAKGRPRARIQPARGGKQQYVQLYTPGDTVQYEETVAWSCKASMRSRPPLEGALSVSINVFLPIPASWSMKKRAEARRGVVRATSKPDLDNYVKAITDGINGLAFTDDSQIVCITATKRYGDTACVEVCVGEVPS